MSLVIDALGNMYYSQLIATEHMIATSAIQVLHVSLLTAFVAAAVISGGGLAGLYIATIAAGLFRVGLHWYAVRRVGIHAQWPLDLAVTRRLFSEGWPIMVASLVRVAYQHIDKVITLLVLGNVAAGYLTAAFVIVFGVTELLNTTVLVALFPLMSRLGKTEAGSLWHLTDQLAFLTLVAALPMAVGISGLSGVLSSWLFPSFVGTAAVLQVLIWHTVVVMIGNLYTQALIILNRQRLVLIIRAVTLALNVVLNFAILPRIGIAGAAVAALISELIGLAWLLIARQLGRTAALELVSRVLRVGVAAVAMAGCVLLLRDVNPILAGVVSMPVYTVGIIGLRTLSPNEWAIVRSVGRMLPIPAVLRAALHLEE